MLSFPTIYIPLFVPFLFVCPFQNFPYLILPFLIPSFTSILLPPFFQEPFIPSLTLSLKRKTQNFTISCIFSHPQFSLRSPILSSSLLPVVLKSMLIKLQHGGWLRVSAVSAARGWHSEEKGSILRRDPNIKESSFKAPVKKGSISQPP